MCGRFTQYWTLSRWGQEVFIEWRLDEVAPRYNLAPGSAVLTLVSGHRNRTIGGLMIWGIQSPRRLLINARAETVEERPMFHSLMQSGRCVIPMNGYFEWHQASKQPYFIHSAPDSCQWAAGLYRMSGEGARLVILTRDAVPSIASLHPRMPVLLHADQIGAWLTSGKAETYRAVLQKSLSSNPVLSYHRVAPRVNKSRAEGRDLIDPLGEADV